MTGTVKGSPIRLKLSSADLGLDNSAYPTIASRRARALDHDVNTIAFTFALAALLRCAGNRAVKPGESEHVPRWIDSFRQVLAECLNDRALLLSVAAPADALGPPQPPLALRYSCCVRHSVLAGFLPAEC